MVGGGGGGEGGHSLVAILVFVVVMALFLHMYMRIVYLEGKVEVLENLLRPVVASSRDL